MSASFACWSSGAAALLSSAAKPMASGFFGQCVGEHGDLRLHLGLGGRAFEGDPHAVLLGLGLGARLDRLPELVLEALADDGDVRFVVAPSATASAAAVSSSVSIRRRRPW
jgi:hypothetical protein